MMPKSVLELCCRRGAYGNHEGSLVGNVIPHHIALCGRFGGNRIIGPLNEKRLCW